MTRQIFSFITLCFGLAQPVSAATITTTAGAQTTCAITDETRIDQDSGTDFSSATINAGRSGCTVSAEAVSGAGYVAARGTIASAPVPGTSEYEMQAGGVSFMRDIMVSAADGFSTSSLLSTYGSFIQITVNANVDGLLSGSVSPATPFSSRRASARLDGSVEIITSADQDMQTATAFYGFNTNNTPMVTGTTVLSQQLNPTALADWQKPFQVNFRFGGAGAIAGYADSSVFADFDGFNTLSFATDGPAFLLPTGFTVNAPELNIFDNKWVDPRDTSVIIAPVPLPASLPLLLAGLAVFGFARQTFLN